MEQSKLDKYDRLYNNELAYHQPHLEVNKIVMKRLGITETIVMEELLNQYAYRKNKLQLAYDGTFWTTYKDISDRTGLTIKQVILAVKKLEELNLVNPKDDDDEEDTENQDDEFKAVNFKDDNNIETLTVEDNGEKKIIRRKWYALNTTGYDNYWKSGDGSFCMTNRKSDQVNNFIVYNKKIAQKYDAITAIIFEYLYTAYMNKKIEGTLEDGKWFKCSQKNMAEACGKSRQTIAKTYIPTLIKSGLVECITYGKSNTTHMTINREKLHEVLEFDKIFEAMPHVERITRKILSTVYEVSGQAWELTYDKMACVEKTLVAGYTEEQMLSIIPHMYDYWNRTNQLSEFRFDNMFVPSKVKQHLTKKDNDSAKDAFKLQLEKITAHICSKIYEISQGVYDWPASESRQKAIKKLLKRDVTEDELLEYVEGRYNHLIENNYSMNSFNWKNLFEEYDDENGKHHDPYKYIKAMRDAKKYDFKFKKASGSKEQPKKTNEDDWVSPRDNVRSKPYTAEEKAEHKRKAAEGEAKGEQWVF